MNNNISCKVVFIVGFGIFVLACHDTSVKPPYAKQIRTELTIHGDIRIDNYYWLNDRDNQKVIEYLEAENNYTKAVLKPTEELQEILINEFKTRIKENDQSVPYKENNYYYYSRYDIGKEYPIYYRKNKTLEAKEEIMLDVNQIAEGYGYYHAIGLSISLDNKLLAYGIDTIGRRKYTIYIKNLETDELLPETISNSDGYAIWANDNKTLFYVKKDEQTLRSFQIYRHELRSDCTKDILVYQENDESFTTFITKLKSNKYLIIGSNSSLSDEYRYLDANNPKGEFKIIQPREHELKYNVSHFGDYFYIRTNLNATNFKLVRTPLNKTSKENWVDVIPHSEDVYLENFEIFKNFLAVSERKAGLNQIRIINWINNTEHYIDFIEETYNAKISTNPDFDSEFLRYTYSSLITPNSVIDYNMVTREKVIKKEQEVPGGFNKNNYESKRIFINARDGKKIALSLVYHKGIKFDGMNPALIFGYGSYGNTIDPSFNSIQLSLLDRGFVIAIAHIRGSQYYGRKWYEDGKLLNKMNTFTDFVDCSEFLIKHGFTNKEKLFALGGSAGGLLMGVVANMRPDLYKGIIALVPFVDVVTTMLDESIPLTTSEFDEWGNPKDKVFYDYMLSYSPYDQVKVQDYPAMLVTTGLHDSQVQYWEPAKWIAKLRYLKTDNNPLLLYTNMEAGHGGTSGRYRALKENAMIYAFIFQQLGIRE